jgi:hypothetical protein
VAPERLDRAGVVTSGGLEPTVRAVQVAAPQRHGHHRRGSEGHLANLDTIEAQEAREWSGDAYRGPAPSGRLQAPPKVEPPSVSPSSDPAVTCGRLAHQPAWMPPSSWRIGVKVERPQAQPRMNDLDADLEPAATSHTGVQTPVLRRRTRSPVRRQHPHRCQKSQIARQGSDPLGVLNCADATA